MGTSTGWHRAAKINCLLLVALSIVLVSVLISVVAKSDGLKTTMFIYQGSCNNNDVSIINSLLHVLINIASTLVVRDSPAKPCVDRITNRYLSR